MKTLYYILYAFGIALILWWARGQMEKEQKNSPTPTSQSVPSIPTVSIAPSYKVYDLTKGRENRAEFGTYVRKESSSSQVVLVCTSGTFKGTFLIKPEKDLTGAINGVFREEETDPIRKKVPALRTGEFTLRGNNQGGYDMTAKYDDELLKTYEFTLIPTVP